ncbi:MAG: glycosyltransferase family 2 protein [Rhodospirillales bacterium]|nr:glycosyltransferase family 2 protein [Rhodospirillales bacterium]
MQSSDKAEPRFVAICACTYRRPEGLAALLAGLARQRFAAERKPALHVVIADNEGSGEVRRICERFRGETGIPLTYVHEPQRGISFARNACLDNLPPDCEVFAFIDDDEVPDPDWVDRLLEAQRRTGADVVQGPVVPVFQPGAPRWLVEGGFLGWPRRNWRGTRPELVEDQDLPEAYTNNVLVRRAAIAGVGLRLRFDPGFALAGGGDSHFFQALHAAGSRIVYAPRAIVRESVPAERATLWYRMRLEYRIAISPLKAKARASNGTAPRRLRRLWRDSGMGKLASGIGVLLRSAASLDADQAVVGCLRLAYGAGQFARTLGLSYHIYR